MGVPGSGKSVSINVVDFVRIRDGKAVEHWGMMDGMTMMQQIGAIPEDALRMIYS
jgi:predicted ester cyclase